MRLNLLYKRHHSSMNVKRWMLRETKTQIEEKKKEKEITVGKSDHVRKERLGPKGGIIVEGGRWPQKICEVAPN